MDSYRLVKFDFKITQRSYDSYVSFQEVSPCLLEDVYEVLIREIFLGEKILRKLIITFIGGDCFVKNSQ